MRRVRIGIDVGGTFTDAVAIDDATQEIIAKAKRPTTHDAKEGVAEGIIEILRDILTENNIAPEEVVFIAHGTTQATNALLEGDVAKVGVIGMGSGFFAGRAASDTDVGDITLAPGKYLRTAHAFIETDEAEPMRAEISRRIDELAEKGAAVIVASEAFGVDHPESERLVMELAGEKGLPSTGGHEVSHLYGLKVRTRTAVINGSLIPRMMETADMTEECVKRINIGAPLMIMRCDGGVMTADEVRRRPILTMLSGLAAGVAGALMYEKLSNGIFLEAGGTSTDISAVRDGRVMVRSGELGGHKMYLRSLDVRTLGVAGGSMIRVENGKITDAGPRSAHIAGLPYEVFSPKLKNPRLVLISPCGDDEPVFAAAEGADGR
ncbi:MAG: hydantoinase/oxoprolinase family protein, partial [Schwartzia sp.]|nr:hydantoinase/oxoprolinase family protein [Schwartzia sp. (in: firmicutes)]